MNKEHKYKDKDKYKDNDKPHKLTEPHLKVLTGCSIRNRKENTGNADALKAEIQSP